jgi:hypothetical protein
VKENNSLSLENVSMERVKKDAGLSVHPVNIHLELLTFWTLSIVLFFIENNVPDTGLSLRPEVKILLSWVLVYHCQKYLDIRSQNFGR